MYRLYAEKLQQMRTLDSIKHRKLLNALYAEQHGRWAFCHGTLTLDETWQNHHDKMRGYSTNLEINKNRSENKSGFFNAYSISS